MKRILTILLSLGVTLLCHAQEQLFDDPEIWKHGLGKIKVISTELSKDSTKNDNKVYLKVHFYDVKNKMFRDYYADLDAEKKEYVSHSNSYTSLAAMRQLSIMTVPFKVRARNKDGYVTAKADVDNIGLFVPFYVKSVDRYWVDRSSNHKFAFGVLLSPMAEELSDKNTQNHFNDSEKSYTALMLSTSLAATYTYNKITFALIPVGFDFGTDTAGKKWINNGKYWLGFGLGIDTDLFGF
ncbi:hypothetical protein [Chryseobacterium gossypii]|uniref:hypothetical protein n=1 Tax=Chryseobacterium gossypii TaxID=3231602 RepID=UPI003523493D